METGAQEQIGRGKAGKREKAKAKEGRQKQENRDRHIKYLGCGQASGSEPFPP